ncbi:hypothetical protein Vretimale_17598, partial [Volvox reticuliferus]
ISGRAGVVGTVSGSTNAIDPMASNQNAQQVINSGAVTQYSEVLPPPVPPMPTAMVLEPLINEEGSELGGPLENTTMIASRQASLRVRVNEVQSVPAVAGMVAAVAVTVEGAVPFPTVPIDAVTSPPGAVAESTEPTSPMPPTAGAVTAHRQQVAAVMMTTPRPTTTLHTMPSKKPRANHVTFQYGTADNVHPSGCDVAKPDSLDASEAAAVTAAATAAANGSPPQPTQPPPPCTLANWELLSRLRRLLAKLGEDVPAAEIEPSLEPTLPMPSLAPLPLLEHNGSRGVRSRPCLPTTGHESPSASLPPIRMRPLKPPRLLVPLTSRRPQLPMGQEVFASKTTEESKPRQEQQQGQQQEQQQEPQQAQQQAQQQEQQQQAQQQEQQQEQQPHEQQQEQGQGQGQQDQSRQHWQQVALGSRAEHQGATMNQRSSSTDGLFVEHNFENTELYVLVSAIIQALIRQAERLLAVLQVQHEEQLRLLENLTRILETPKGQILSRRLAAIIINHGVGDIGKADVFDGSCGDGPEGGPSPRLMSVGSLSRLLDTIKTHVRASNTVQNCSTPSSRWHFAVARIIAASPAAATARMPMTPTPQSRGWAARRRAAASIAVQQQQRDQATGHHGQLNSRLRSVNDGTAIPLHPSASTGGGFTMGQTLQYDTSTRDSRPPTPPSPLPLRTLQQPMLQPFYGAPSAARTPQVQLSMASATSCPVESTPPPDAGANAMEEAPPVGGVLSSSPAIRTVSPSPLPLNNPPAATGGTGPETALRSYQPDLVVPELRLDFQKCVPQVPQRKEQQQQQQQQQQQDHPPQEQQGNLQPQSEQLYQTNQKQPQQQHDQGQEVVKEQQQQVQQELGPREQEQQELGPPPQGQQELGPPEQEEDKLEPRQQELGTQQPPQEQQPPQQCPEAPLSQAWLEAIQAAQSSLFSLETSPSPADVEAPLPPLLPATPTTGNVATSVTTAEEDFVIDLRMLPSHQPLARGTDDGVHDGTSAAGGPLHVWT